MTTQTSEILIYDSKKYLLTNSPLEIYFELGGAHVPFMVYTTMCWRGYVGTWCIESDQLHLVNIHGHIAEEQATEIAGRAYCQEIDYDDRSICRIATIDSVFPGWDAPIFAHWYSGPLKAVDSDSRSFELLAEVKRGRIVSLKTEPVGDQA